MLIIEIAENVIVGSTILYAVISAADILMDLFRLVVN